MQSLCGQGCMLMNGVTKDKHKCLMFTTPLWENWNLRFDVRSLQYYATMYKQLYIARLFCIWCIATILRSSRESFVIQLWGTYCLIPRHLGRTYIYIYSSTICHKCAADAIATAGTILCKRVCSMYMSHIDSCNYGYDNTNASDLERKVQLTQKLS